MPISVVLPEPVGPTIAVTEPGSTPKLMSLSTGRSGFVGKTDVVELNLCESGSLTGTASGSLTMSGSISRMSNARVRPMAMSCALVQRSTRSRIALLEAPSCSCADW